MVQHMNKAGCPWDGKKVMLRRNKGRTFIKISLTLFHLLQFECTRCDQDALGNFDVSEDKVGSRSTNE